MNDRDAVARFQMLKENDPSLNAGLDSIFADALRKLRREEPLPIINARFYPYAGLSSTIRSRKSQLFVRISDILTNAPQDILFALACILVAKLYRMRLPREQEKIYRSYTSQIEIMRATDEVRRSRGYKVTSSPAGQVYNLETTFQKLNHHYFEGALQMPRLSWSPLHARRVLGHHDQVHDTITISRILDSDQVPLYVVEYVLYHEMLHIKHSPRHENGRTIYHSKAFRDDEKRFKSYPNALDWLEKLADSIPRRKKRRRRLTG